MNNKQLADIVLDSIKISRACVDAKVCDGGKSGDYLAHVKEFYNDNQADSRTAHLQAMQEYLVDMRSVEVEGMFVDRLKTALKCGKYAFAAGSACVLAVPLYPALGIVAAASAGISIGCSLLLKQREKRIAAAESKLKEEVENPQQAIAGELKSMDVSEIGAVLEAQESALTPYLS